jgi:hypothetical protein
MDAFCPACGAHFPADLVDTGFTASSFAYCAKCGTTAICRHSSWPPQVAPPGSGPLSPEQTSHLRPCTCGGYFHTHGMPRCPSCRTALDPIEATGWIEAGTGAATPGWTWQGSWLGLYAVVIGDSLVGDPWLPRVTA